MALARVVRSHRSVVPRSLQNTRPPLQLNGALLQAARAAWIAVASGALVLWCVEIPLYYHAALRLGNTNGMVNLRPDQWRAGLYHLGLSPSFYAAHAVAGVCLQTWPVALVGFVIFLRRSKEWMALFISLTFMTFGGSVITNSVGQDLISVHPELSLLVQAYANVPYLALFLIPLLFPDGRFVPHWTRWLVALFALLFATQAVAPGSVLDFNHWPIWLIGPLNVFVLVTILVAPCYRYRYVSNSVQREQTKWVVLGLLVALGAFFAAGILQVIFPGLTATPERAVLFDLIAPGLALLGFIFLSISFGIAILRYRLWDIDLILNRTLVYAVLTAGVIGLYVLIVAGLGAVLQVQGSVALSLPATVLAAILFQPLRERTQRGVNRLMYGERDDPYAVISRLGRQLETTLSPDAILPVIVQTAAQALKLPYAAIALRQDNEFIVAAAAGTLVDDPVVFPLLYQGDIVGRMIVGTRSGEEAFSAGDRRLLDDLARQAGIAAHAVRLTTDLRHSRQRLVTAREEERRRLRRDLHDGLGPALATMAMQSEAARDLLASDPAQTAALLDDLMEQLQAATSDIRRLVHELRPPALDDLGLVGALRNQLGRYERGGLAVTLDALDSVVALPAAVEVAAYRIVMEALNNAARHAEAATCCVRLTLDAPTGLFSVEIRDDGRGLPTERQAGVGLTSMRERAAELGGICVIQAGDTGGTLVRAALPAILDPRSSAAHTPVR